MLSPLALLAAAALAAPPAPKPLVRPVLDTGWEVSDPPGFVPYQDTGQAGVSQWRRKWRRVYRKDHRRAVGEGEDTITAAVMDIRWGPHGEWPAADVCRTWSTALVSPVVEGSHYGAPTFSYTCGDAEPDDNNYQRRTTIYDVLFQGRTGRRYIALSFSADIPNMVVRSDADVEIPAMREATVKDSPNLKSFRLMEGTLHPTNAAASPDGPAAAPAPRKPADDGDHAVPMLR